MSSDRGEGGIRPFPSPGRRNDSRPQRMNQPRALEAPEFVPSGGFPSHAPTTRNPGRNADHRPRWSAQEGAPPYRGRGNGRRDNTRRPPSSHGPGRAVRSSTNLYANNRMRDDARKNLIQRHASSPVAPQKVDAYYRLDPLEATIPGSGPGNATVYKAISSIDGEVYALRRFVGFSQSPSEQIVQSVEAWKQVRSPGIISLKEAFTSRVFSPNQSISEVVFVYDFFPQADTLADVFFADGNANISPPHPIPENTLWSFAIQILSLVYAVHKAGLTLRDSMSPTGILLTGRNRLRANKCGVSDAFDPDGAAIAAEEDSETISNRIESLQKQDLSAAAKLLLALAARSAPGLVRHGHLLAGAKSSLDYVRQSVTYSEEIVQLITFLLGAEAASSRTTVQDALALVAPRMSVEYGNVWVHADAMEAQVYAEMDASRMLRLITLLGFVNEREGGNLEVNWSETGDNYMLKLFRDYLFHQNDNEGRPVLDYSHIMQNMARLDAGTDEQLLLSSRDGQALLVASYADMKRCLYNAIDDLRQRRPAQQ